MNQPLDPTLPLPSGREFVERPHSLDDLRARRPKFVSPLTVAPGVKLVDVLTPYSFEKKEKCGLSTCKQWHYYGYHVITSDGAETNIGHKCGEREFGIEFKLARARYKRDEDQRVTVGRALELQAQAPRIKEQIQELANRKHGVRWLYSVRDAVRSVIGRNGYDLLRWRADRNDYAVVRVREIPAAESGTNARGNRSRRQFHYVNENLGTLAPMDWMVWDFPGLLFKGVRDEFLFLAELSPAQMNIKELKKRLKQFDGWEQRIKDSEGMLSQAIRFLDPENLRVVDLAIQEGRTKNGGAQSKSLVEWAKSDEYALLLLGTFKDGQTLSG